MKDRVSNFLTLIVLLCILALVYKYNEKITRFIVENFVINQMITIKEDNLYTKNNDYIEFKITDNYAPQNKEELKNMFYTMLNKGADYFSFYCPLSYEDCFKDITDSNTLAIINNYVHPYNSYKTINITEPDYFGIVDVQIIKKYTSSEIDIINNRIDQIIKNNITDNMSTTEKIKVFHDYIVNHTTYDKNKADLLEQNNYETILSSTAYNIFINGTGICSEYTDALSIFLNKIGVNNFKISTKKHIWNAVNIDGNWKHIDITWDDPISNVPILLHDYFLIDDNRLKELDSTKNQHNYDKSFYLELKD